MGRRKATHTGNCQICARHHKLPDGRVAKHGYQITDHQFWAECPGSGYPPYQMSCDRLKEHLVWLESQLADAINEWEELKMPPGTRGVKGWKQMKNAKGTYWAEVEYCNKPGEKVIGYRHNGEECYEKILDFGDPAEVARQGDIYYTRTVLNPKIRELNYQVELAKHRINTWVLSDLLPLLAFDS